MELKIVEINEKLVSITCPEGKVFDTRTNTTYSEVDDLKKNIKFFKGVE